MNDQITQRSSTRDAFTRFPAFAGFKRERGRGRWGITVENAWLLTGSRCRRAPRANSFVSTKYDWSTWWRVATVCRLLRRPCCWRPTALWPTLREPAIPSLGGKETLTLRLRSLLPRVFCPHALLLALFSSFEDKKKETRSFSQLLRC